MVSFNENNPNAHLKKMIMLIVVGVLERYTKIQTNFSTPGVLNVWICKSTTPCWVRQLWIDPFRPSDSSMHQWTRPSSVRIITCRLSGAKLLAESTKCIIKWALYFSKIQITIQAILVMDINLKMSSAIRSPFRLILNVLERFTSSVLIPSLQGPFY